MITIISYMCLFFFFNDPATTEIYTLSLHDALPICLSHHCHAAHSGDCRRSRRAKRAMPGGNSNTRATTGSSVARSEEHTSELQSQSNLVCRLLLEKKKNKYTPPSMSTCSSE